MCGRFQQLSGPATAKGIEDTAFYAYAPLLSRNEVGGGPDAPLAGAAAAFHAANARRAAQWPGGLLAVTTHDTKRTADVRARLDVLSEIPAEWAERIRLWRTLNLPHKRTVRGRRVPDPATVYHIFQAMVGIWPMTPLGVGDLETLRERIDGYMVKAVREAKVRTTWTDPDESFEDGLRADIEALLRAGSLAPLPGRPGAVRRANCPGRTLERAESHRAASRVSGGSRPLPGRRAVDLRAGRPG